MVPRRHAHTSSSSSSAAAKAAAKTAKTAKTANAANAANAAKAARAAKVAASAAAAAAATHPAASPASARGAASPSAAASASSAAGTAAGAAAGAAAGTRAQRPSLLVLFFALSRTVHGLLDACTPAMAALLYLGHFPVPSVILVGILAAFAGYTAVYAVNDIVDVRVDREMLGKRAEERAARAARAAAQCAAPPAPADTDASLHSVDDLGGLRHPVARGLLPMRYALAWCAFWASVAAAGAFWLNPVCFWVLVASVAGETLYCVLLKITHHRVVSAAFVKPLGAVAGVLAVDAQPDLRSMLVLVLWLACWEVGAQNIPNDIVDVADDDLVHARTTATVKGVRGAALRSFVFTYAAAVLGVAIWWFVDAGVGWLYPVGAALLAHRLLLVPAHELLAEPSPERAGALFSVASLLPPFFLILVGISIIG